MKRLLSTFAAAIALSGCTSDEQAKLAVKKLLNDPDSAQFSDLTKGKSKGDVCGTVNAKNRMGGYAGATPFFYEKSTETAAIVTAPESSDFRMVWLGIKGNDFANDLTKVLMQCRLMDQWESTCNTPHAQQKHRLCDVVQGDPTAIYAGLKAEYDK